MANWYVDYVNGNDANSGLTTLLPKKTIQAAVNLATGGDDFNLANTGPHIVATQIVFNTGFTSVGGSITKFKAWDNGGSVTTKLPTETTPRVAAQITATTVGGNAAIFEFIGAAGLPTKTVLEDIILSTNTASSTLMRLGSFCMLFGCEVIGTNIGANTAMVSLESTYPQLIKTYLHSFTNTNVAVSLGAGGDAFMKDCFVDTNSSSANGQVLVQRGTYLSNNIIKVPDGRVGVFSNAREARIWKNTIIGAGGASSVGLSLSSGYDSNVYNNLYYKFDGASAKPITVAGTSTMQIWGGNAFFDCNAADVPSRVQIQLTDVSGTGDPFVDAMNNDYSIAGTVAQGAGLGFGSYDMGAVQSAAGGGGSSNVFIINE